MHESMKRLYEVAGTEKHSKIAKDLNVGPSTVTNWSSRGVSKEGALAAATKYNVDANYILHGEESIQTLAMPQSKRTMLDGLKQKADAVTSRDKQSSNSDFDLAPLVNTDMLPVISWVAAGSFSLVDPVTLDDIIDSAPSVPRYPDMSPKAFGLIIKGRSMAPIFQPGDIIHVEPEITPWDLKDGDLVVVLCDDGKEATFKQLIIGDTSDDMYLKPLNPDWHEQKIIPMGECHLVGKVKHCTKNF